MLELIKAHENSTLNDEGALVKNVVGRVKLFEAHEGILTKIYEKGNIVLTQGKEFIASRLTSSSSGHIVAIQVGSGGARADTTGGKHNTTIAIPPNPDGTELINPIPFRFHDASKSGSGDDALDYVKDSDRHLYGNPITLASDDKKSTVLYRMLDAPKTTVIKTQSGDSIVELNWRIEFNIFDMTATAFDPATSTVSPVINEAFNEIGFVIGNVSGSKSPDGFSIIENPKLITHFTMPTRPIDGLTSKYAIEYTINII